MPVPVLEPDGDRALAAKLPRPWVDIGCGDSTDGDARVDVVPTKATTHTGPADRLPFPDDTFEAARLRCLLEHVDNPSAVLREAARVVKPGGLVLVVTDNAGYLGYRYAIGQGWADRHVWLDAKGQDEHIALFDPPHLRNIGRRAGLACDLVALTTIFPRGLLSRLLSGPFPFLFQANLVAVYRKPGGAGGKGLLG